MDPPASGTVECTNDQTGALVQRIRSSQHLAATSEAQTLEREIEQLVHRLAPCLLEEPGVGPISAGRKSATQTNWVPSPSGRAWAEAL